MSYDPFEEFDHQATVLTFAFFALILWVLCFIFLKPLFYLGLGLLIFAASVLVIVLVFFAVKAIIKRIIVRIHYGSESYPRKY